jgi:hypothetical protein
MHVCASAGGDDDGVQAQSGVWGFMMMIAHHKSSCQSCMV